MKKVMSILLSILLLAACLPLGAFSVSADTVTDDGLKYEITNDQVTITGYTDDLPADLVIPDTIAGYPVTVIEVRAFYKCTALTSVTIPDSVTSIEEVAFCSCTALTSVTIGDGVTSIGKYAFRYCFSLQSITVGSGVTSIGEEAFDRCDSLSAVYITDLAAWCAIDFVYSFANPLINTCDLYLCDVLVTDLIIPEGVTSIKNSAFLYCSSLTSVTIPDSVTTIGNYAFSTCTSLTEVTISNSVTAIGTSTFYGCTALTSVTIGDGVTSIGDAAFYACTSLASVAIPDGVVTIGTNAFDYCTSLASVTLGDGVTTIGEAAFNRCRSLKSIIFPDNVTSIGREAFSRCASLTSAIIPNGITTIENYMFYSCSALVSITIPDSVTSIGECAFYGCESLTDVYYDGDEEQKAAISIGNYNDPLLNATWHYNATPICDHVYDDDADPDCNACGVLRWAVCPDTDVTIRHEDGTVLPAGTTVTVDAVEIDESDVNLGEQTALVVVYDISLLLNGQEVQPDGVVAVTLPAPADAARYTDLQVVYIDDAGNVTPCKTVINEDGTITFYTDHFSYYAIVGTPAVVYGDANGDGAVNNRDVALLQQYINKWEVVLDMTAADANGDGAVNNRDVALLQQYNNHWDVELG